MQLSPLQVFCKGYWIEYYHEGRRKRERIRPNKALAQTVLQKRLVERAEGKLLDKKKVSTRTFTPMIFDTRRPLTWSCPV